MFFFLIARFFRSIWVGLQDREFRALFTWVLIVIAIGTVFYSRYEGWRVLDALYFTIITLTTIGYGDFALQTGAGKIFTMIYIFVGLSLISGFIILLGEHSRKLKRFGKRDNPDLEDVEKPNPLSDGYRVFPWMKRESNERSSSQAIR